MRLQFEWDDEKNRLNRSKHGIGFEEASLIFTGPVLTAPDDRKDYSEERFVSYGQLGPMIVVSVVNTWRRGRIRLISARRANRKERQAYYAHLGKAAPGN
jgi:uncharacterized DUF497 family protein